jgi:hypothetical protein
MDKQAPNGGSVELFSRDDSAMAKRPGEDPDVLHRKAQVAILSGLAAGKDDVFELMNAVAPYDVRHHFTPDVALLDIAAAALGLACPPGSKPLECESRGPAIGG